MNLIQAIKHHIFGYGTNDSHYKTWYLRYLAWRAPKRNWVGIWRPNSSRPWVGNDARLVSDAEMREIIKQNANAEPVPDYAQDFIDWYRKKHL